MIESGTHPLNDPAPDAASQACPLPESLPSPTSIPAYKLTPPKPILASARRQMFYSTSLHRACTEVITKLALSDGRLRRYSYEKEIQKEFALDPRTVLHQAQRELRSCKQALKIDEDGKLRNPQVVGAHFTKLWAFLSEKVDVSILAPATLGARAPLPDFLKKKAREILQHHEVAILLTVRTPPEEAVIDIKAAHQHHFGNISMLWSDPRFSTQVEIPEPLKSYLAKATVRIVVTGKNKVVSTIARSLNEKLEKHEGFEDKHAKHLVMHEINADRKKMFKGLRVCVPSLGLVNVFEYVIPGSSHAVATLVQNVCGIKKTSGALFGVSIPFALTCGWAASALYSEQASLSIRASCGVLFALGCSVGTLSMLFSEARRTIVNLEQLAVNSPMARVWSSLSQTEKTKAVFYEVCLCSPFRMGQTFAFPLQILFGGVSGAVGFFDARTFVIGESVFPTLLGAVTSLLYPLVTDRLHRRRLLSIA